MTQTLAQRARNEAQGQIFAMLHGLADLQPDLLAMYAPSVGYFEPMPRHGSLDAWVRGLRGKLATLGQRQAMAQGSARHEARTLLGQASARAASRAVPITRVAAR